MSYHDMGGIIKYCDKVVLLNKGEFIAEGEPGHMVDLYKKIWQNQLDSLKEELEATIPAVCWAKKEREG